MKIPLADLQTFYIDKDKIIYLVAGDEVGVGFDKEPVLKNIKIIKKIPKDNFHIEQGEIYCVNKRENIYRKESI